MLIEHGGVRPRVPDSAYVAPTAVVCGDVELGKDCRVLFGAVITAESPGSVVIGERCVVMENALIRGRPGHATWIGRHVVIGPHAHINGAELGSDVFVATGVSIFPGARIGGRSELRINAVVHVNSSLAEDSLVPIGWVAVGDPARSFPPSAHDEIWAIQRELDFPGTVFGLPREHPELMSEVSRRYAELFGRHRDDSVLG
jgi:carbonic anhydrase/acetyltransferase-like protein (isoleucine patch superfamily)